MGLDYFSSLEPIKINKSQLADRLGYKRFWFTEHHNNPIQMSKSPDLLSLHVIAHTQNIRDGSGGIMLPNHSPLKVVGNFTLL
nr:LLM class flavin-dependent oxidoreductase [Paenibacillus xylanexedens]